MTTPKKPAPEAAPKPQAEAKKPRLTALAESLKKAVAAAGKGSCCTG